MLLASRAWYRIPLVSVLLFVTVTGRAGGEVSIDSVVARLEESASGRGQVQKAMAAWGLPDRQEFLKRIRWGASSRTDAVLIRHYDPSSGVESRERDVVVYLRERQGLEESVLDLAHELVHASSRPAWDPYDPSLTAAKYIRTSIEGPGGEVEAVAFECQVGHELKIPNTLSRCRSYDNTEANEQIRKDFYRVGKWMGRLQADLGDEFASFPLISPRRPTLYSSTGGTPYPVSLLDEYKQMTSVACKNTRKRAANRSPAALQGVESPADSPGSQESLFLSRRCSF